MDINDKKANRISALINWTISVLLATFLIILSQKILSDLAYVEQSPVWSEQQYLNADYRDSLESFNNKLNTKELQILDLQTIQQETQEKYYNQKESFENWLATRTATGKDENDPEVIKRTRANDLLLDSLNTVNQALSLAKKQYDSIQLEQTNFTQQNRNIVEQANDSFEYQSNRYQLRVFGVRLLFTLPILLLGVWMFVKFRRHKYRSLVWGFIIYSIYVFFFALVPYLPSFGGYIRASVGVILTLLAGIYAIKYWNKYAQKKREQLAENAQIRKKTIVDVVAQKAYAAHICPSCGKDFLPANWEKSSDDIQFKFLPKYCMFCGMEIYSQCKNCGKLNYAHTPFCRWCGADKSKTDNAENIINNNN